VTTGRTAQAAGGREFASALPTAVLDAIQSGTFRMRYRNLPLIKSPFDMALYLLLIQKLKPRTVIEIGTYKGGSALWFADMLSLHGIDRPRVISIDSDLRTSVSDERITFVRGDARALHEVLDATTFSGLERPLLVIDDASHLYADCLAVLDFFHDHLARGEYIVIEDGNVSQFSDPVYAAYEDGPNRAVADFLGRHADAYAIDTELCDHFGYNVTYNPNGWLRRR
jgi:cephalosporin hydroxylase